MGRRGTEMIQAIQRGRLCQIYRGYINQTELRDVLCRIDHRCHSTGDGSRMQTAEITAS
jgi:hypothetical protein